MKAMIFAAGLGTRLFPLTANKPKALVEVNGQPMIALLIHKLASKGINQFVVNVHHYADDLIQYLSSDEFSGYEIFISNESDLLLETGGGIAKAKEYLLGNDPVLVHNVDIETDLDYSSMIDYHNKYNSLATLAVRQRSTSRYLLFDDEMKLSGWENIKSGEQRISRRVDSYHQYAFSGIQIISQDMLGMMNDCTPHSIIDTYLNLAKSKTIMGYVHNDGFWMDLGKPEAIEFMNNRTV